MLYDRLRPQEAAWDGVVHQFGCIYGSSSPGERGMVDASGEDGRVDIARVDEIRPGEHRLVTIYGSEIGIYNLDGEFYAVRNYCPHRGAPICLGVRTGTMVPSDEVGKFVWGMEGRVLRCPWHRWEFDLVTGRTVFGTDKRRLIQYRMSVEGDRLLLHLRPEERRRMRLDASRHDDEDIEPGGKTEWEGTDGTDH